MILLDTHAALWLMAGHARARLLHRWTGSLHLSPASLFEMQVLMEVGKIRLREPLSHVAADARWLLDAPPSDSWFERAWELAWTRDPFDRLLVAHARLRRWRLATSDAHLLEHLGEKEAVEL